MLKNHPKGLVVLFFSNMGERFGFYTMLAIFTLYFEGSFGISIDNIGFIWGAFLFSIYFIPLFGGMLADKLGYGKVVLSGMVLMFFGYVMLAVPGQSQIFIFVSLFVIAAGTGFFKGNLVVILGNLYEEEKFKYDKVLPYRGDPLSGEDNGGIIRKVLRGNRPRRRNI